MNKAYLESLVNDNKKLNYSILVILLLSFPIVNVFGIMQPYNTYESSVVELKFMYIALTILTLILPVYNLRRFQSKKSGDTYYALPITRKSIITTILVYTALQIIIPFTISYAIGMIIMCGIVDMVMVLGLLITTIINIIILLIINMFIVEKCNTTIDSIIILIGYHSLVLLIIIALDSFISNNLISGNILFDISILSNNFSISPYNVLIGFQQYFTYKMQPIFYNFDEPAPIILFVIYSVVAIIAYKLLVKSFKNRQAENCDSLTNNKWTYPFIINACTICFIMQINFNNGLHNILFPITILLGLNFIGLFISQRSFKLNKKVLVTFAIVFSFCFGFTKIAYATEFFNIANSFEGRESHVSIYFDQNVDYMVSDNEEMDTHYRYEIDFNQDVLTLLEQLQYEIVDDYYANVEYEYIFDEYYKNQRIQIDYVYENSRDMYMYEVSVEQYDTLLNELEKLGYDKASHKREVHKD